MTGRPRRHGGPVNAARLLLIGTCATACAESGRGPRATVRDSAGIAITENASPDDSSAYAWWTISSLEIDLGGDADDEMHSLFRVVDAHRRSDGSIVVANSGSSELRVFDATGTYTATWGRRGSGPGEFQSLSSVHAGTADTLLVWDGRERRMSVLGPDGALARDFTLGENTTSATPIGRLPDGGLAGWTFTIIPGGEPTDGMQRAPAPVLRFAPDGSALDTIGVFPGAERVVRVNSRDGQILSIEVYQPPFARTTQHAVSGDDIWVGTQDAAEIRVYAPDGTLRRIVRTGHVGQTVTPQHVEAWIERTASGAPEEARQQIRDGMRGLPHGEIVPAYGQFLADDAGRVWVSDYNDPLAAPGRWTIHDAEGRGIARITLPARFQPYQAGVDWILGRQLDDFDVEHVRLYRISTADPTAGS
ncbi:MAG: 6-bladed beta-propeller [Gemmatimonadetes bacterium]|nr:6-bladed beta-propeller [Gemmatimonadota bacterium]